MIAERLMQQINFLVEIDKLKQILRQTRLINEPSRQENDAEHSWHLALFIMLLSEYVDEQNINILRTMKMVLIHDLVEIDAGDIFTYDVAAHKNKFEKEKKAAKRLFGLLPQDQAEELYDLWVEFERCETSEARFAAAVDRLQPFLNNFHADGVTWKIHDVPENKVLKRMAAVQDSSKQLGELVTEFIEQAVNKGFLKTTCSNQVT